MCIELILQYYVLYLNNIDTITCFFLKTLLWMKFPPKTEAHYIQGNYISISSKNSSNFLHKYNFEKKAFTN